MKNCPDCNVKPGEPHLSDCDVARCPKCGGQRLSCDCSEELPSIWTGEWPGVVECREYGFYCVPGSSWPAAWYPCAADYPGATEDLNRLYRECVWDEKLQKMVKRIP